VRGVRCHSFAGRNETGSLAPLLCTDFDIEAGSVAVIPPQAPHQVELLPNTPDLEMFVEFWKDPNLMSSATGTHKPLAPSVRRRGDDTGVPLQQKDFVERK